MPLHISFTPAQPRRDTGTQIQVLIGSADINGRSVSVAWLSSSGFQTISEVFGASLQQKIEEATDQIERLVREVSIQDEVAIEKLKQIVFTNYGAQVYFDADNPKVVSSEEGRALVEELDCSVRYMKNIAELRRKNVLTDGSEMFELEQDREAENRFILTIQDKMAIRIPIVVNEDNGRVECLGRTYRHVSDLLLDLKIDPDTEYFHQLSHKDAERVLREVFRRDLRKLPCMFRKSRVPHRIGFSFVNVSGCIEHMSILIEKNGVFCFDTEKGPSHIASRSFHEFVKSFLVDFGPNHSIVKNEMAMV